MTIVFQYGSNTDTERLNGEDRLDGAATPIGLAVTAADYDLAFTYFSRGNGCAAADLIHGRRTIYGVLYDIPDERVFRSRSPGGPRTLDEIEGTGYAREDIEVTRVVNGQPVSAVTYLVLDRKSNLRTAPHYVRHIVEGLRAHGAPEGYIDYVKQRAIASNPAQQDGLLSL